MLKRKPIICAEDSDDLQSKINIIDFLMWYVIDIKESTKCRFFFILYLVLMFMDFGIGRSN